MRNIKFFYHLCFDGFIETSYDSDADKEKYTPENFFKHSSFVCNTSKTRNETPTSESDENEHHGKSDCIDKSISDTSYDRYRKYCRKEEWVRRRTSRENWAKYRTSHDSTQYWISYILSGIEGIIWARKFCFLCNPCPTMWEDIDKSESEKYPSWEIFPERRWYIDKCGRNF